MIQIKNFIKEHYSKIFFFTLLLSIFIYLVYSIMNMEDNTAIAKKELAALNNELHKDDNVSLAQEVYNAKNECFKSSLTNKESESCTEIFKMELYTDHNNKVHFGTGDY